MKILSYRILLIAFLFSGCFGIDPCNDQKLGHIPLGEIVITFPTDQSEFSLINQEGQLKTFTLSRFSNSNSSIVVDRISCSRSNSYYLQYFSTDAIERSYINGDDIITFNLSPYNMDYARANPSGRDMVNADYLRINGTVSGHKFEEMWILANDLDNNTNSYFKQYAGAYENSILVPDTTLAGKAFQNIYVNGSSNSALFHSKEIGFVGFRVEGRDWVLN